MKRKCNQLIAGCFILLSFFIYSCSTKKVSEEIVPSFEFSPYISAYTGGIITKNAPIQIQFTQNQTGIELFKKTEKNPFQFTPQIKGESRWISANTIEFTPSENLKPGELYKANFNLDQFISVPSDLKTFSFTFRVLEKLFTFRVTPIDVRSIDKRKVELKTFLTFSDVEEISNIESLIAITIDNQKEKLPLQIKNTALPNTYEVIVSGITRQEKDQMLELIVDGQTIGIEQKEIQVVNIPALDLFDLVSVTPISVPENGYLLTFTDPLSSTQDLTGLVELSDVISSTTQIDENKLYLYFDPVKVDSYTLNINQAIKNIEEETLGIDRKFVLEAKKTLPSVELLSDAVILPNSEELILPFRSVNLSAVDLQVIQIYENNILSFLQDNQFTESSNLRRSGRLIHQETLDLTLDKRYDLSQWNNFSIDLAKLFKHDPGSIYRINLSFKQEYSLYSCEKKRNKLKFISLKNTSKPLDDGEWDQPNAYYSTYYKDIDWSVYDWRQKDNPCHPTYYMMGDRQAACNIIASNIGVTVKRNNNKEVWVALNNILTIDPIANGEVIVYNYQLQPIGKGLTDAKGLVKLDVKGIPFILVASKSNQKTYLRLVDGEEKSTSRFDVGGEEVQKGLKGFLYGERGVWRPGDTLHLTFILHDEEQRIPAQHPVLLEIFNPRGQFYTQLISTEGINGFYFFAISTEQNDPTGIWNAYVKVGGSTFHKSLRIEAIKPNRLKIKLKLPEKLIQVKSKIISTQLYSEWLTGAKASNLKSQIELSLSRVNTQFDKYSSYQFNNPAAKFSYQKQEVYKGELNNEGKANIQIKLPEAKEAPGMLQSYFTTQVFEPGGNASIYTQTVPYSPFDAYVGIQLKKDEERETDENHRLNIVVVDALGQLVGQRNLEYDIYKLGWSWWWDNSSRYLANYVNNESKKPIKSGNLTTSGGKSHIDFRVNYPDWGAYFIYVKDVNGGHATGGTLYIDWPSWRGRANRKNPTGISMLSFSVDKKEYQVGEKVTTIIPSSSQGKALVSLENGSRVLKQEWITVSSKEDTRYKFEVTPEMAPNIYIHITLLQPHIQTVNNLPIRMYGVVPVFVSNEDSKLQPKIKIPKELEPEKEFAITVSEQKGRPMTYTVAIVDEGLLDLTGFKTPNPWDAFNVKEALGIRTWDMFDDVLGANSGAFSFLFSIGGDESLKRNNVKINRFKPIVRFMGPFILEKGKSRTHQVKLPMYVGSVRTMVVAGQKESYGSAEQTSYVRSPLMLLSTLPRIVSTNEDISLPIQVFSFEKGIKQVEIKVESSHGSIEVVESKKQIKFTDPGDQVVFFSLKTKAKTGKEIIKITAQGGGKTTHETIEINIRNPNPPFIVRKHTSIERHKTQRIPYEWNEQGEVLWNSLEVSRMPSFNISEQLNYLKNYDHTCTEQLVSRALPLLYMSELKNLTKEEEQENRTEIQNIIQLLYGRQLSNGGFEFWPGINKVHDWLTSYVGQFLTLAQEKGFAIQPFVLNRWKKHQQKASQNWTPATREGWSSITEAQQAYRLYSLSLVGSPNRGAMNRLKEVKNLSLGARWRLAAAYALDGKKKTAEELVFNTKYSHEAEENQNLIFSTPIREEAMILETLLLLDRDHEAINQGKKIVKELVLENYYSTQTTAYTIYAMAKLSKQFAKLLKFDWTFDNKTIEVNSAQLFYETTLESKKKKGEIILANKTEGNLNATLTAKIQPLEDKLPSVARNIELKVLFTDMNGKTINPVHLEQGTEFYAVIRVSNISGRLDLRDLVLTHIIPSGWDFFNSRLYLPNTSESTGSNFTYQDIRDDRVLTYFDLPRNTHKVFTLRLQAAYKGKFVFPAIQCEAMYDADTFARTAASWVKVD